MNAKLLMVGVGCGVTLIGVNHETNQLPVQQRTFATAAQSIVARRPLAMETAILFPDAATPPGRRTRFPDLGSRPDWGTRVPDLGSEPDWRTRATDQATQPDRRTR